MKLRWRKGVTIPVAGDGVTCTLCMSIGVRGAPQSRVAGLCGVRSALCSAAI